MIYPKLQTIDEVVDTEPVKEDDSDGDEGALREEAPSLYFVPKAWGKLRLP